MDRAIKWASFLAIVFLLAACDLGVEVTTPVPEPEEVELSVLVSPQDKGYVEVDGSIVTPGAAVPFKWGKQVSLVARPLEEDWHFAHWERDLTGTDSEEVLLMDSSKVVRAVFASVRPVSSAAKYTGS